MDGKTKVKSISNRREFNMLLLKFNMAPLLNFKMLIILLIIFIFKFLQFFRKNLLPESHVKTKNLIIITNFSFIKLVNIDR